MNLFPINLNVDGRRAIVVGGGTIALRKAQSLVDCGADVVAISPEFCPELGSMPGVTCIERCYETGDLEGAAVAISATDSEETNSHVWRDAQAAGIPVNVVDQPDRCTFTVPAVLRRGDLMVTISTGGGGPALSGNIRRQLEGILGPEYGEFLELLKPMRKRVRETGVPFEKRAKIMRAMSAPDVLALLRDKGHDAAQTRIEEILVAATAQFPAGQ